MVSGLEPHHWRLAPRYRHGHRIIEVAELVERGEWTSYGDISQVVYGHARAGMAVGSAARSAGFSHPHRVLQYTGQIPAEWTNHEGRGAAHLPSFSGQRVLRSMMIYLRTGGTRQS